MINTQDVTFNPLAAPHSINLPKPVFSSDNGMLINDALLSWRQPALEAQSVG